MRPALYISLPLGLLFLFGCVTNPNVTPLMKAAKSGDVANVRQLIGDGTNIDEESAYGWTALMFAAHSGHDLCARALLKAGAQVDHAANNGATALMLSCNNGHDQCARALLKAGADVNPTLDKKTAPQG